MNERKPNRVHGYDYSSDNLYFVTSCVHERICCFGEIVPVNPAGTGRDVGAGRDLSLQQQKIKSLSELIGALKQPYQNKSIYWKIRTGRDVSVSSIGRDLFMNI